MRSLTGLMVLFAAIGVGCGSQTKLGDDTGIKADANADADADPEPEEEYDWPEGSELKPVYEAVFFKCKGCHADTNPTGGLSLTEANLRQQLLIGWVVAGDSESSLLLEKMSPDWVPEGDPMPKPDGSPPEDIAMVAEWIDAGANP